MDYFVDNALIQAIFLSVTILVLTWMSRRMYTYCRSLKAIRKIPGRPRHWLLGNLHEVCSSYYVVRVILHV